MALESSTWEAGGLGVRGPRIAVSPAPHGEGVVVVALKPPDLWNTCREGVRQEARAVMGPGDVRAEVGMHADLTGSPVEPLALESTTNAPSRNASEHWDDLGVRVLSANRPEHTLEGVVDKQLGY